MGYAAYAMTEDDLLDLAVGEAVDADGGDVRAAILALVRRQHRADGETEAPPPAEGSAAAA